MTFSLTSDLENLFSNAHSHGEYLCQVSLKFSTVYSNIESREIGADGQRTDEQTPAGRTDRRPENTMLSAYYCWLRHKMYKESRVVYSVERTHRFHQLLG